MLDQIPLQLDREGIKEREDGERDGGGGNYYLREEINQGTAFIQGNMVTKEKIVRNNKMITKGKYAVIFFQILCEIVAYEIFERILCIKTDQLSFLFNQGNFDRDVN